MRSPSDWTEQLLAELEEAAELAQRGGTVSDVLREAKAAAERGAIAARECVGQRLDLLAC